jgi:hypothetical protein
MESRQHEVPTLPSLDNHENQKIMEPGSMYYVVIEFNNLIRILSRVIYYIIFFNTRNNIEEKTLVDKKNLIT